MTNDIFIAVSMPIIVFIIAALITTEVVFRLLKVRGSAKRVATAAFSSMMISAIVASTVIGVRILWVRLNQSDTFECCGFFEGGLAILLIWLVLYSVIYIVTTFLTADLIKKGKLKVFNA